MRLALVVTAAVGGCFNPAPTPGAPCSEEGSCPSGLTCIAGVCELPGASDGGPDPIDAPFDACPAATCEGDELVGCGARVTCDHGCTSAGGTEPHCAAFVPANGLTTALLTDVTATVDGNDWRFNTEDGEIRKGNIILRAAGTGVIAGIRFEVVDTMGVFVANQFSVAEIDDWGADGGNALVLFARETITVAGVIDVGANFTTPGPDGSTGNTSTTTATDCRGRAGRFIGAQLGEGGGGGGGGTAGGNGGASNQAGPTGIGGTLCTTGATTQPLDGGAGGGAGGASSANAGGAGGGAIALVAMTSITVTGQVGAPGGGAYAGAGAAPSGDGGGGGGGGGAILLDAPTVDVAGDVTANGGSGAAPYDVNGVRGSMSSATPALGGLFSGPGGAARGGNGGAGSTAPTNGASYNYNDGLALPTSVTSRGGGGGGAVGRIELRASTLTTNGALLSPPAISSTPTYE